MIRTGVTDGEMRALLAPLASAYSRQMTADLVASWHLTLRDCLPAEVEAAIGTLLRDGGRFMPIPAAALRLILDRRPKARLTDEDGAERSTCPQCGEAPGWYHTGQGANLPRQLCRCGRRSYPAAYRAAAVPEADWRAVLGEAEDRRRAAYRAAREQEVNFDERGDAWEAA